MKITKIFPLVLLATMLMAPVFARAADTNTCPMDIADLLDGDAGEGVMIARVAGAFNIGSDGRSPGDPKFLLLKRMADEMALPACRFLDGRLVLGQFIWGLLEAYKDKPQDLSLSKLKALREAYPNDAFPIIAEAAYWIMLAGEARGTGYANTVTEEMRKLQIQHTMTAAKILTENPEVAQKSTIWYGQMFGVQKTLGANEQESVNTFLAATKNFKTYLPHYIMMRNSLEPKWGGSWKAVDDFIIWAADSTRETEGSSFYPRLYYGVYDNLQPSQRLFRNTKANWSRMAEGCRDLIARYPRSKDNLRICAAMACEAGQRKAYLAYRKQFGADIRTRNVVSCDDR